MVRIMTEETFREVMDGMAYAITLFLYANGGGEIPEVDEVNELTRAFAAQYAETENVCIIDDSEEVGDF